MRRLLLGGLISFSVAFLAVTIIEYFVTLPKKPQVRDVKIVQVNGKASKAIDVKDKVVVQKTVNNTDYLNSWKLSATILGKTSFAMVVKGRESKVLQIKDVLEGYDVKKIEKEKVLFSTAADDVWLYIKTPNVQINNNITNVVTPNNVFVLSKNSFKKNIQNPERLLSTINVMPEIQTGVFQGLKVDYILEGSFLYVYGLRKGDIIKKINNKKLLSIADGISAYQNIASSTKFTISVLRDNEIKELRYEIH